MADKTNRTQSLSCGGSVEGKMNSQEELPGEKLKPVPDGKTVTTPPKKLDSDKKSLAKRKPSKSPVEKEDAEKNEENPRSDRTDRFGAITDPGNFVSNDICI